MTIDSGYDENKTTYSTKRELEHLVRHASYNWKEYFNSGNAKGCATLYHDNAVMHARPFGSFTGLLEIENFWQKLINDGYSSVTYHNLMLSIKSDNQVILTADWTMNKAKGIIHKELWTLDSEGILKLLEDDFEVTG